MKKIQADWLNKASVQKLVAALGRDQVRFVGGAVRDTLAGKPVDDLDAATAHLPEETVRRLKKAGIKVIPTGLKHGTVTALVEGDAVEITTLRVDVETDGRHAEVAFTNNWLADAKRRDFTMNALYLSADGSLFDPFAGEADLNAGVVRFIGDADTRIEEDALRILRFFRFYARYGRGEPNSAALSAITANLHRLGDLSAERVLQELRKLFRGAGAGQALVLMNKTGVLKQLFGGPVTTEQCVAYLAQDKVEKAFIPALFFLTFPQFSVKAVAKRLKLSRAEARLLSQLEAVSAACIALTSAKVRELLYKYGREAVLPILSADTMLAKFCDLASNWVIPEFPVQGRDLMACGKETGPEMGGLLAKLEHEWIESDFTLSKQALLQSVE